MSIFGDELVESVTDSYFDPTRSDTENEQRIHDALSQFGFPTQRADRESLHFAIEDEIHQRRGTIAEQALGWNND